MHLGGGGEDWLSISESSSKELSVTNKKSASTGSTDCSEDLVFTPDFPMTDSNGRCIGRVDECINIVDKWNTLWKKYGTIQFTYTMTG